LHPNGVGFCAKCGEQSSVMVLPPKSTDETIIAMLRICGNDENE